VVQENDYKKRVAFKNGSGTITICLNAVPLTNKEEERFFNNLRKEKEKKT